ncbi:RNA polymerase sigma factor region1.1 domain-containing protein [Microvirga sp. TS319]|uniref:RNA polymerase sigma factor region1.1 domain-containing protein n=1 Tax=Microvirga sp. TS319 TaxID=3241165 RepID=UPI00351A6335
MQPAFDSDILGRLVSLGRERGHLTTADLRAGLPIERMSAEEIALVVVHLEETGIPVELEKGLLPDRPKPTPAPRHSAQIIPFPGPRAKRSAPNARPALPPKAPPVPQPPQATDETPLPVRWIIAGIGVLVFTVASLAVFAAAI